MRILNDVYINLRAIDEEYSQSSTQSSNDEMLQFYAKIIKHIFTLLGNISVDNKSPARKEIMKFNILEITSYVLGSSLIPKD